MTKSNFDFLIFYQNFRHVLEKIQALKIPRRFRENVDLASLMVKSKPYHDNEELLTMCYRCSSTNPLMNNRLVVVWWWLFY